MASTEQPFDSPTGEPVDVPSGELGRPQFQDSLKNDRSETDNTSVTDIDTSMHQLIDHVVDQVPGVLGVLVSSADGLVIASRITHSTGLDAPAIAAMSAAVLGLSNRLVQLMGSTPTSFSYQRSADGQVFVFGISSVAVLTVLADPTAAPVQIQRVGREIGLGLERLFRGAANV